MKKLIVVISILFVALTVTAQTEEKKENALKPLIEFETLVHDFGKIYEGRTTECEFIFFNRGKAPLILSNVQPGCGCTTPEWPREPIMPGQKSKIKAIYNPGSYKGSFGKGITVYSNASNAQVQLTIKGVVEEIPKVLQSPVKLDVGGGF
ncbi:MAG: DUF1573 domain-containing protein [Burkholderiales bacterium]|nr:DUF1573 domain-containing protein [Bacteroidia bacterium]